jgi:ABC-type amino acid transport substrate-binding protein
LSSTWGAAAASAEYSASDVTMTKPAILAFALSAVLAAPSECLDLAELRKAGVLRVIVAADEQPGRYNGEKGGASGFDGELLASFARLQKLKLETVKVPRYDDRIPALLGGKGDLIIAILETPERRTRIAFARQVLPARWTLVTHVRRPPLTKAEQLADEKMGILDGAATWLQAALDAGVPRAKLKMFPSLPALLQGLGIGEITATVMPVTDFGIAAQKHSFLQPGPLVGVATSDAWAVRPADTQLLKALNDHLEAVRATPAWNSLATRYFGREASRILSKAP